jgi:hypothetical protein
MVYACTQEVSSRDAVKSLKKLAGLEIERRQLERWTHRIGRLRVAHEPRRWSSGRNCLCLGDEGMSAAEGAGGRDGEHGWRSFADP